jgi:hypothetical protein
MITEVRDALTSLGYTVHTTRQEKLSTGDMVVTLEDCNVEIETTATYWARSWIAIEWETMDPDNIPTSIVTLVEALEEYIVNTTNTPCKATFKFVQSEVNQLGLMYRVSIIIEYVEEIRLD